MLRDITVLVVYEDEKLFSVWSDNEDRYLSPEEWKGFISRLSGESMLEERSEKSEREGTD